MYVMIGSRPDIAFAVGKLARFCETPKTKHWTAVKRVLRYVNGTSSMGHCAITACWMEKWLDTRQQIAKVYLATVTQIGLVTMPIENQQVRTFS